ncbi:hypothetical protein SNEBB_003037 [Seison nebaliae]|nr:hypothetical protein SNEBB_003037 [Seison nebaliae]
MFFSRLLRHRETVFLSRNNWRNVKLYRNNPNICELCKPVEENDDIEDNYEFDVIESNEVSLQIGLPCIQQDNQEGKIKLVPLNETVYEGLKVDSSSKPIIVDMEFGELSYDHFIKFVLKQLNLTEGQITCYFPTESSENYRLTPTTFGQFLQSSLTLYYKRHLVQDGQHFSIRTLINTTEQGKIGTEYYLDFYLKKHHKSDEMINQIQKYFPSINENKWSCMEFLDDAHDSGVKIIDLTRLIQIMHENIELFTDKMKENSANYPIEQKNYCRQSNFLLFQQEPIIKKKSADETKFRVLIDSRLIEKLPPFLITADRNNTFENIQERVRERLHMNLEKFSLKMSLHVYDCPSRSYNSGLKSNSRIEKHHFAPSRDKTGKIIWSGRWFVLKSVEQKRIANKKK